MAIVKKAATYFNSAMFLTHFLFSVHNLSTLKGIIYYKRYPP